MRLLMYINCSTTTGQSWSADGFAKPGEFNQAGETITTTGMYSVQVSQVRVE